MLQFFRVISVLEGLSFLTILAITLGMLSREFVFPVGMGHGVLFLLYILLSLIVCTQRKWSLKIWLPLFAAGFIPFAFIFVELFLKKMGQTEGSLNQSETVES